MCLLSCELLLATIVQDCPPPLTATKGMVTQRLTPRLVQACMRGAGCIPTKHKLAFRAVSCHMIVPSVKRSPVHNRVFIKPYHLKHHCSMQLSWASAACTLFENILRSLQSAHSEFTIECLCAWVTAPNAAAHFLLIFGPALDCLCLRFRFCLECPRIVLFV